MRRSWVHSLGHPGVAGVAFPHFKGGVTRIWNRCHIVCATLAWQAWHFGIFTEACAEAESATVGVRSGLPWQGSRGKSAFSGRRVQGPNPQVLAYDVYRTGGMAIVFLH